MTIKQKMIEFLKIEGFQEVPSKNKYTIYMKSYVGRDHYYFLGNSGAVRKGFSPASTKSISVTTTAREWLKKKEIDHGLV